jgi:hypothetical protein
VQDEERAAMLGIGLFVLSWCLAHVTLGKADEIRLAMPIVPLGIALAAGRWCPWPGRA